MIGGYILLSVSKLFMRLGMKFEGWAERLMIRKELKRENRL